MTNDPNNLLPNYDNLSIRAYQKIHVDETTDTPGSYPILGYNTEMSNITLKTGCETSFHYPLSGINSDLVRLPLVSSTLITDGAVAGTAPYKSDRIFKLNRGYKFESKWGEALPKWMENGTWLCAWLSGEPNVLDGDCIWVDRWYNPDGIEKDEAYRASASEFVYDRVSELTFDQGCYYRYYHIGNEDINRFIDDFNFDNAMVYHFNDWLDMKDNTSFIFHNFINDDFRKNWVNRSDYPYDYAITFNGENQSICVTNDPNKNISTEDFSIMTWVKCDDWINNCVGGIIDNGFRGGWTIGAVNNAVTNFMVFPSKSSALDSSDKFYNGNLILMNAAGTTVEVVELGENYSIAASFIDIDSYVWIIAYDTADEEKRLYPHMIQLDFDGNIVRNEIINLPVNVKNWYNVRVFSTKDDNVIYFAIYSRKDSSTNRNVYKLFKTERYGERYLDELSGEFEEDDVGVITLDGVPVRIQRTRAYIGNPDKDNPYGAVRGLASDVKIGMEIDNLDDVIQTECDYNGDVWVLTSETLSKYHYDTVARGFVTLFKINRKEIRFSAFGLCNGAIYGYTTEVCFIVNDEDNVIYLYNAETGEEMNEYLVAKNRIHPLSSTFSSYDWWRMFGIKNCIYARVCMNNGRQSAFSNQHRYTLVYNLSDNAKINYGWHHVVLVKQDYILRLYIDCQLVDSTTINTDDKTVAYSYRSQIVLGGTSGRKTALNDEVIFQNGYSNVAIDDVRIYRRALRADDIYYIYISKFKFNDLKWNIKAENKYYIEELRRFFRFKMPGSKSAHYRIVIGNYGSAKDNPKVRRVIEDAILAALPKVSPAITKNTEIVWD